MLWVVTLDHCWALCAAATSHGTENEFLSLPMLLLMCCPCQSSCMTSQALRVYYLHTSTEPSFTRLDLRLLITQTISYMVSSQILN